MAQHRADYMAQHKSKCAKRYLKWLQQHNNLDDADGTAHLKSAPKSLQLGSHIPRGPDTQRPKDDNPPRSQYKGRALHLVHEHIFDARLTGDALTCALTTCEEMDDIDAYGQALVAAFRLNITFDSQNIRPLQESERFSGLADLALMIDEVNRDHSSISKGNWNGMTVLDVACASGLAELLEPLFWRGASFNAFDEDSVTPLTYAVQSGDLDTVIFALALGADPNLGHPFVMALSAGRRDIMETLTKYGANVNEEDSHGDTALGWAADKQNWDEVHFLLSLGATPNSYSLGVDGIMFDTIWHCDCQDSDNCVHEQIALTLLDHGVDFGFADDTGVMLRFALRKANLQLLGTMLKRISSPDMLNAIADDHGLSVLHCAAEASKKHSSHRSWAMASMLLEAGADINARTYNGYTALDHAAGHGNEALVKLLLDAGADINTPHNRQPSVLTLAARKGKEAVVQILMDAGVDVNMQDEDGDSALIAAAMTDHVEIVRMLLDAGADINLRNKKSRTALFRAVVGGCEDVVRVLLDAGADVDVRTALGNTALSLAAGRDKKEIVRHLLAAGAKIDTRTLAGPMRTFVETVLGESGFRARAK
jgi:ankyrin repeat protein